ncbi:Cell cycle protein GpsB [Clostridium felsineum]|uniref:Cell cycle protein GpsB n=2 Tax=Clostridium felsineum TaxID=36839 RepID=A0A1S8L016_9CLOT|nr:Cell cycle protein GpsB [Clostridium felsineum]URZ06375.1 Cell cycle protein GpsB [Clostridium felsineum]URZ11410.1 Cell cycle protein GpsB [Clostridium felsineum]URZ16071.1 Cell cycle protein GpsB [Clostridium felsineum DSM 794]
MDVRLTPMDINTKEFRRALRGFDTEEVDQFLDQVSENYEQLYKENSELREKTTILKEKLAHYEKIEDTIQNTLILAQNAAEQAKESAKTESDLILKNANDTAQRIIDKANQDVIKINDDYDNVKQQFMRFRAKYRNFMNSQLDMFNSLENDFENNYNVSSTEKLSEKEIEAVDEKVSSVEVDNRLEDVDKSFADDLEEVKKFFVK